MVGGLDPRILRRALLRGAIAVLLALLPTLLARHLVALPPCVALAIVPFTLIELGWERLRGGSVFAFATILCGAALLNAAYVDGVVREGTMDAGLRSMSATLGVSTGHMNGLGVLLVTAQILALAFTLSIDMLPREGARESIDPIIFGPLLVGAEAALFAGLVQPRVAFAAGLVFSLVSIGVAFTGAVLIRCVCLAADRLERRVWPEVAT